MSEPFALPPGSYANVVAIGALSPKVMPPSVFDEILALIPPGGMFVFSLNDHAIGDAAFSARLMDLIELGAADLLQKDHGEHLPGIELASTVFVLRKR